MSSQIALQPGLHEALTAAMERLLDFGANGDESIRVLEQYFLACALKRYRGNQCNVARRLQWGRTTIGRKVGDFDLYQLIRQIRNLPQPQMELFKGPIRKFPGRVGFAQDQFVLNRNSQARKGMNSQLTNRVAAGSA